MKQSRVKLMLTLLFSVGFYSFMTARCLAIPLKA